MPETDHAKEKAATLFLLSIMDHAHKNKEQLNLLQLLCPNNFKCSERLHCQTWYISLAPHARLAP